MEGLTQSYSFYSIMVIVDLLSKYNHFPPLKHSYPNDCGGDTSITRKASKEPTKHYKLRTNAWIPCHPYEVNNMLILTKKFKSLPLEDIYISKDLEDMKRSKPMKMWCHPLILRILKILPLTWPNPTLDLKPLILNPIPKI